MKAIQYKIVFMKESKLNEENLFNEYGKDGWELIQVIVSRNSHGQISHCYAIFKNPTE